MANCDSATSVCAKPATRLGASWPRREATLNWLALGLLLAAWNAVDHDSAAATIRRPEGLKGYAAVSVRALNRTGVAR